MLNVLIAVSLVGLSALIFIAIAMASYWFAEDMLDMEKPMRFTIGVLVLLAVLCVVVSTALH